LPMQLATLVVCVISLLSNDHLLSALAEREEARLVAQSGLPELERNLIVRPNSFLYYYTATEHERFGRLQRAKEHYAHALQLMDLPAALLLLDEAGDESDFGTEILDRIRMIKLETGAERIPALAHYFLQRGYAKAEAGLNPEKSFEFSSEMDPIELLPRIALIRHYLRTIDPRIYGQFQGIFRSFHDFSIQYSLLLNAYLITSVTVTIGFFLYLVTLFVKHARAIYHALLSTIPTAIPYHLRVGVVALLILIPILLGFDRLPFWVGVVFVVALFCSFRERALLILGSVLLLSTPLLSRLESRILEVGDAFLLYRAQVSPSDIPLTASLYAAKAERPSYGVNFSLGLLEKRREHFTAAEQAYVTALEENPDSSALHNNLGNVLFATGRFEEAISHYEAAIKFKPGLASAHYNLSQAHLKLMNFDKYTEEIEIANRLDFELVTEFMNNSSDHPNRAVVDELVPNGILWREVLISKGQQVISPILRWKTAFLVFAGSFLIVSLIILRKVVKLARMQCSVCGAPVCEECARLIEEETVCSACAAKLKLTKSPGIQQKMAQRIKGKKAKLKKLTASMLSVLPGLGHIYLGSTYSGFFLLMVSIAVVLAIIYNGLPYQLDGLAYRSSFVRSTFSIVLAVLIARALVGILRKEVKVGVIWR